ncbi:MAG: type II toxin-antitoxin system HicB family antitoxin [Prosthecobacter sp.]
MNQIIHQAVVVGRESIALPQLSAVITREGKWHVSTCPELGIASQGGSRDEALVMLQEAVKLWLTHASAMEIRRHLRRRGQVKPLVIETPPAVSRRKATAYA